jgi:hypothetical protein
LDVKAPGLTGRGRSKLESSSEEEESRIPGVVVECVEIGRNASGESGSLVLN